MAGDSRTIRQERKETNAMKQERGMPMGRNRKAIVEVKPFYCRTKKKHPQMEVLLLL